MFEVMPHVITIVGVLIFIITIVVFIFVFILMFNPKIRGKFMSKQIKATKYMMDDSKDDIQDVSTNLAKATKDSIEITTRAIKKVLQMIIFIVNIVVLVLIKIQNFVKSVVKNNNVLKNE